MTLLKLSFKKTARVWFWCLPIFPALSSQYVYQSTILPKKGPKWLQRSEWATKGNHRRRTEKGWETTGRRGDRKRGRTITHVTDWVSIGPLCALAGACHLSDWLGVWMVAECCNGVDTRSGSERFQLLVMNSYQVMADRLASSTQHMQKRSHSELKR